jgi:RimJ/RimL family protein N-acetyltransferase
VIPVVETPRLVLRGWRAADFEAYAAMLADASVARFVGGVLDAPGAWRQMALHTGHWALRGYGNWAVERRSDGVLLGRAGLWQPEGWPGLEVGWMLARDAWGQGYATEAARAAISWAWTELAADRLISIVARDNPRSVRVAERLGMRRASAEAFRGRPVWIYALDRPGEAPPRRGSTRGAT